jgi:hypothetical protein
VPGGSSVGEWIRRQEWTGKREKKRRGKKEKGRKGKIKKKRKGNLDISQHQSNR